MANEKEEKYRIVKVGRDPAVKAYAEYDRSSDKNAIMSEFSNTSKRIDTEIDDVIARLAKSRTATS